MSRIHWWNSAERDMTTNLMTRKWDSCAKSSSQVSRVRRRLFLDAKRWWMQSKQSCICWSILILLFWRLGWACLVTNQFMLLTSVEMRIFVCNLSDRLVMTLGDLLLMRAQQCCCTIEKSLFNTSFSHAKPSLIKTRIWQQLWKRKQRNWKMV